MLPPADFKGPDEKLVNVVGTISGRGLLLLKYDLFFFFFPSQQRKRQGRGTLMGGGPPRKRCLCVVCRGLPEAASANTCCLHAVCHRPEKPLPHALPERAERIRSLSSLTLCFPLPESQAWSLTWHLGSRLP